MLLKNLIRDLRPNVSALTIKGISFDTRNIKKRGDLFVSIKGDRFNGNNFIDKAILKGAKVIFYSGKLKQNKKSVFVKFKDTREVCSCETCLQILQKKTKKYSCCNRHKRKDLHF